MLLAATLAKLGRMDEAKAAARRLLELQPDYTISGMCAALPIVPIPAAPLAEGAAPDCPIRAISPRSS